jgi:hypothetical protein
MAGGARAAGSQRTGEGPITKQEEELRRKEKSLNRYVFMQSYLLMAVIGIGYLALMWSTVVLLGGFVTTLRKKDFWCITVISMMQAARSVMSSILSLSGGRSPVCKFFSAFF